MENFHLAWFQYHNYIRVGSGVNYCYLLSLINQQSTNLTAIINVKASVDSNHYIVVTYFLRYSLMTY